MFEPGNTDTDTFLLFDESNKNSTQSELDLIRGISILGEVRNVEI